MLLNLLNKFQKKAMKNLHRNRSNIAFLLVWRHFTFRFHIIISAGTLYFDTLLQPWPSSFNTPVNGCRKLVKHKTCKRRAPRRRATYKCSECFAYTYIVRVYITIYIHSTVLTLSLTRKVCLSTPDNDYSNNNNNDKLGGGEQPVSDIAYFHTSGLISYCKQNGRQTCFRHGAVAPACLP